MRDDFDFDAFVAKRTAAAVCAMLVGGLGVHKFLLGLTAPGVLMLGATVVSGGCAFPFVAAFAFAEGITYLFRSDEAFYHHYAVQRRAWF